MGDTTDGIFKSAATDKAARDMAALAKGVEAFSARAGRVPAGLTEKLSKMAKIADSENGRRAAAMADQFKGSLVNLPAIEALEAASVRLERSMLRESLSAPHNIAIQPNPAVRLVELEEANAERQRDIAEAVTALSALAIEEANARRESERVARNRHRCLMLVYVATFLVAAATLYFTVA